MAPRVATVIFSPQFFNRGERFDERVLRRSAPFQCCPIFTGEKNLHLLLSSLSVVAATISASSPSGRRAERGACLISRLSLFCPFSLSIAFAIIPLPSKKGRRTRTRGSRSSAAECSRNSLESVSRCLRTLRFVV